MEISNTNVNFKAKKFVSVTRYLDTPVQKFEKFEVYKVNENDIPFIKKICTFLDKNKNKLNDMQKQLHEHFKKILNDKYYFVPQSEDRLYIGIKDDNFITGFLKSKKHYFGGKHEITDLCVSKNSILAEDAFAYAIQKDTPKGRVCGNIKDYAYYKKDILPTIEKAHPEHNFDSSKPKKEYDLEEVLGLNE